MICQKTKTIFIHIPKTAGQSIEHLFLENRDLHWRQRSQLLLRPRQHVGEGPERLAHLTATEYISCGHIDANSFEKYYRFSIIRNPWDRLVSEYFYHKLNQHFSFEDFLRFHLPLPGKSDAYRHIIPQKQFIYNNEKLLVDFVGRFENLALDLKTIMSKVGIAYTGLPHINASARGKHSYQRHYNNYTKDWVKEYYAEDIDCFGYEFE